METNDSEKQGKEKQSFSTKLKKYFKNLFDFSQLDTKTKIYIGIFIALIVGSIALVIYVYLFNPTLLYRIVVEWFVNPIFALGIAGIFLFIGIMAIQGLIIPLPSELVLLSTGIIWGLVLGGFMGVIGSMSAALLCFFISKRGGRPLAEKFVGEKAINLADDFIHKYGIVAILIARFLPFIAFDPISYASGLVDMDIKKYTLGTLVGSFPRAFFYSWLGASLGIPPPPIDLASLPIDVINAQSAFFNNILLIIFAVLAVMFLTYYIFARYYEKKRTGTNPNQPPPNS
ncbi:MAG: TVP38/TMEM64 family protein [Promethearchaeota archaeon]